MGSRARARSRGSDSAPAGAFPRDGTDIPCPEDRSFRREGFVTNDEEISRLHGPDSRAFEFEVIFRRCWADGIKLGGEAKVEGVIVLPEHASGDRGRGARGVCGGVGESLEIGGLGRESLGSAGARGGGSMRGECMGMQRVSARSIVSRAHAQGATGRRLDCSSPSRAVQHEGRSERRAPDHAAQHLSQLRGPLVGAQRGEPPVRRGIGPAA